MNIIEARSDKIYEKMMNSSKEKRNDIYRYELMKIFEFKWECINVQIKAKQKNAFDVVMASGMLGFLPPTDVDEYQENNIKKISDDKLWNTCKDTIKNSFECFTKEGLNSTGFENITAYLYGDEMAEMKGYFPIGLPYCAGYACGYNMIKHYLKKTGKSIVEATLLPYEDIIK